MGVDHRAIRARQIVELIKKIEVALTADPIAPIHRFNHAETIVMLLALEKWLDEFE